MILLKKKAASKDTACEKFRMESSAIVLTFVLAVLLIFILIAVLILVLVVLLVLVLIVVPILIEIHFNTSFTKLLLSRKGLFIHE